MELLFSSHISLFVTFPQLFQGPFKKSFTLKCDIINTLPPCHALYDFFLTPRLYISPQEVKYSYDVVN